MLVWIALFGVGVALANRDAVRSDRLLDEEFDEWWTEEANRKAQSRETPPASSGR